MAKRLSKAVVCSGAIALLLLPLVGFAADIVVKALLKDKAVVEVDGQQKLLRMGDSFAGITLISADSKAGVFDVNGTQRTMGVGRRIGATYKEPDKAEVRINSHRSGHYYVRGAINSKPVTFHVDTGATMIAMSSVTARQLGIDYLSGRQHRVQTASGIVAAYGVTLAKASVGPIVLNNVEASVLEGAYPRDILLGNSYLSRVNMRFDDGVLVLQAKF